MPLDEMDLLRLDAESGKILLKKIIINAYPRLAHSNTYAESFEDVLTMIRTWVSGNISWGTKTFLWDKSMFHIIVGCILGKEAVRCTGFAHILGYLLNLFGIQAAVYTYGIPGVYTHSVTLASDDGIDPFVLDPSFNLSYGQPNGNLLRFGELCDFLRAGNDSMIIRKIDPSTMRFTPIGYGLDDELLVQPKSVLEYDREQTAWIVERISSMPKSVNWYSGHGFPFLPIYLLLCYHSVEPPRGGGGGRCNGNVFELIKSKTEQGAWN